METWQNIGVQLGISGLVVMAAYRVAILLINKWSENDKIRTAAMVKSDEERTEVIRTGFQNVTDVHALLSSKQDKLHTLVLRIDQKVSTALELTPVEGTTVPPGIREAIETPSRPLEEYEPKVIVREEGRKTPPGGVRVPRHRTSG